ncbi:MAG: hypothetical protein KGP28_02360 [Bdellovibrionales bacterium]|nr:hypothetical protein [Bdellovibrionales bacterium]
MSVGRFLLLLVGIMCVVAAGSNAAEVDLPEDEQSSGYEVPSKNTIWFLPRILRNSSKMIRRGVKLMHWRQVLKVALREKLKRDPTPAEYDFQEERFRILVSDLVKHFEFEEEGNVFPLPSGPDDHKLIRISGFDVLNIRRSHFEDEELLRTRFLCVEDYCFIPVLFHLESEWRTGVREFVFLRDGQRNGGDKKKSSVACPKFRDRSRSAYVVVVPYPRLHYEKTRLHHLTGNKYEKAIFSKVLGQYHFRPTED